MTPYLPVDVVICCYTAKRWPEIVDGIAASRAQTLPPSRVVVVVDYNDELYDRLQREQASEDGVPVEVIRNDQTKGLSGARNTAIAHSSAALLAFLDDDARPDEDWLETLVAPFAESDVWATGGHVSPRWPDARPSWFPPEFDWVVGCTYTGMPTVTGDVRNVHGASMAFRRDAFERVGGFVEGVGRVDTVPKGCEETELCIRIEQSIPGSRVVYVVESDVSHMVTPERVQPRYYFSRCWAEGLSKAAIAELVEADAATQTEREYVRVTLVGAVVRNLRSALSGDRGAAARAAMVVAGLVWTGLGYVLGSAGRTARRRLRPA